MQETRNDNQVVNQTKALNLLFESLKALEKSKKQVTKDFVFNLMKHSMKSKKERDNENTK